MNMLADLATTEPQPFWQAFILAIAGPLIVVIVGGLFATLFVERRNLNYQTEFRAALVSDMAIAAKRLYLVLKVYRGQVLKGLLPALEPKDLPPKDIQKLYIDSRAKGEAIEVRLKVHFGGADGDPWEYWHAAMDCLTVCYYDSLKRKNEGLRETNRLGKDGLKHSGLTKAQLLEGKLLEPTFEINLDEATKRVLESKLKVPRAWRMRSILS